MGAICGRAETAAPPVSSGPEEGVGAPTTDGGAAIAISENQPPYTAGGRGGSLGNGKSNTSGAGGAAAAHGADTASTGSSSSSSSTVSFAEEMHSYFRVPVSTLIIYERKYLGHRRRPAGESPSAAPQTAQERLLDERFLSLPPPAADPTNTTADDPGSRGGGGGPSAVTAAGAAALRGALCDALKHLSRRARPAAETAAVSSHGGTGRSAAALTRGAVPLLLTAVARLLRHRGGRVCHALPGPVLSAPLTDEETEAAVHVAAELVSHLVGKGGHFFQRQLRRQQPADDEGGDLARLLSWDDGGGSGGRAEEDEGVLFPDFFCQALVHHLPAVAAGSSVGGGAGVSGARVAAALSKHPLYYAVDYKKVSKKLVGGRSPLGDAAVGARLRDKMQRVLAACEAAGSQDPTRYHDPLFVDVLTPRFLCLLVERFLVLLPQPLLPALCARSWEERLRTCGHAGGAANPADEGGPLDWGHARHVASGSATAAAPSYASPTLRREMLHVCLHFFLEEEDPQLAPKVSSLSSVSASSSSAHKERASFLGRLFRRSRSRESRGGGGGALARVERECQLYVFGFSLQLLLLALRTVAGHEGRQRATALAARVASALVRDNTLTHVHACLTEALCPAGGASADPSAALPPQQRAVAAGNRSSTLNAAGPQSSSLFDMAISSTTDGDGRAQSGSHLNNSTLPVATAAEAGVVASPVSRRDGGPPPLLCTSTAPNTMLSSSLSHSPSAQQQQQQHPKRKRRHRSGSRAGGVSGSSGTSPRHAADGAGRSTSRRRRRRRTQHQHHLHQQASAVLDDSLSIPSFNLSALPRPSPASGGAAAPEAPGTTTANPSDSRAAGKPPSPSSPSPSETAAAPVSVSAANDVEEEREERKDGVALGTSAGADTSHGDKDKDNINHSGGTRRAPSSGTTPPPLAPLPSVGPAVSAAATEGASPSPCGSSSEGGEQPREEPETASQIPPSIHRSAPSSSAASPPPPAPLPHSDPSKRHSDTPAPHEAGDTNGEAPRTSAEDTGEAAAAAAVPRVSSVTAANAADHRDTDSEVMETPNVSVIPRGGGGGGDAGGNSTAFATPFPVSAAGSPPAATADNASDSVAEAARGHSGGGAAAGRVVAQRKGIDGGGSDRAGAAQEAGDAGRRAGPAVSAPPLRESSATQPREVPPSRASRRSSNSNVSANPVFALPTASTNVSGGSIAGSDAQPSSGAATPDAPSEKAEPADTRAAAHPSEMHSTAPAPPHAEAEAEEGRGLTDGASAGAGEAGDASGAPTAADDSEHVNVSRRDEDDSTGDVAAPRAMIPPDVSEDEEDEEEESGRDSDGLAAAGAAAGSAAAVANPQPTVAQSDPARADDARSGEEQRGATTPAQLPSLEEMKQHLLGAADASRADASPDKYPFTAADPAAVALARAKRTFLLGPQPDGPPTSGDAALPLEEDGEPRPAEAAVGAVSLHDKVDEMRIDLELLITKLTQLTQAPLPPLAAAATSLSGSRGDKSRSAVTAATAAAVPASSSSSLVLPSGHSSSGGGSDRADGDAAPPPPVPHEHTHVFVRAAEVEGRASPPTPALSESIASAAGAPLYAPHDGCGRAERGACPARNPLAAPSDGCDTRAEVAALRAELSLLEDSFTRLRRQYTELERARREQDDLCARLRAELEVSSSHNRRLRNALLTQVSLKP